MWQLACPVCQLPLDIQNNIAHCPQEGHTFERIDGIWRLLPPNLPTQFSQFIQEYETIRLAEGRSSADATYYRNLPFTTPTDPMASDWAIRAQSYASLQKLIGQLWPNHQPHQIIDMGAGNGWLSHRLAQMGQNLLAIDLTTNAYDGLGTHTHYEVDYLPVQAQFNHLPLLPNQADMVIFNASFHYTINAQETVQQALRVLKPLGYLIIIDTPFYQKAQSGQQMLAERAQAFEQQYGFASNALPNIGFLTYQQLNQLAQQLGLPFHLHWSLPKWRRGLRQLKVMVKGEREPAKFPLVWGQKPA